jgi:hypothetical protein
MDIEKRSRVLCRFSVKVAGLVLLLGVLGFMFVGFLLRIDAASYDITVTLTSNSLAEGLYSVPNIVLQITEPTGEAASYWHDTTSIGGWITHTDDYQRYHLANAMDGYYYIDVQADDSLIGDTDVSCQVTVLLYEGTSKETIINYWPFIVFDEWTKVGCFKMPDATKEPWGETADSGGSSCFIATAAYGTEMAGEVRILSRFRDKCLTKTRAGERLVGAYYVVSPPIARIIAKNDMFRKVVRLHLKPYIALARMVVKNE